MGHQQVIVKDLGRIAYADALEVQRDLLGSLVDLKKQNRPKLVSDRVVPQHYFLFCEHDPVITLGRTGSEQNLLVNAAQLDKEEISFYRTNRGGDITFHGPGQIVGYPIFDLEYFFTDVHKYVRYIEEGVIRTLLTFNILGKRVEGYTGVWLEATDNRPERKICAIGIHLSRWISMHGFAFNVNTDLRFFDKIIPCGISDDSREVTSLAKELGHDVDLKEVKKILLDHYAQLFEFDYFIE
ncbi:MAG: lipoyl(octanoyl) transferase LipB [Saprospiraceae bacterium]|nr:lipoyl(octanoyl) transferase LipB [Saprospiraceae bacterium]